MSHPIQHFAPWYREVARRGALELHVLFCCDWGVQEVVDPGFATAFKWDVPLTEGYSHEFLPIARRPRRLGFFEVDNPQVATALDRFEPDVVQVLGWAYRTNWRALAWARRCRRPVLLYTDSNVKEQVAVWKVRLKRPLIRRFYRRVDGALYVGDNNRAYHRAYGLPEERLFPGVYPIDRARLLAAAPDRKAARRTLRSRHGVPEDAFLVISCGKYLPRKRHLDLAAAAAQLAARQRPVWALLVGEGPQRPELEAWLRQRQIRNVALTGFVNQAEIPHYYAAADAVAVPSDFDPHPLVVSEAASFGLPVLASDAIGCIGENDTARPDVNALVFPCGDVAGLVQGIARLLDDPALRRRMGEASLRISEWQDASVAAEALARASQALVRLGPRRTR